jgi:hypothetical protein
MKKSFLIAFCAIASAAVLFNSLSNAHATGQPTKATVTAQLPANDCLGLNAVNPSNDLAANATTINAEIALNSPGNKNAPPNINGAASGTISATTTIEGSHGNAIASNANATIDEAVNGTNNGAALNFGATPKVRA